MSPSLMSLCCSAKQGDIPGDKGQAMTMTAAHEFIEIAAAGGCLELNMQIVCQTGLD